MKSFILTAVLCVALTGCATAPASQQDADRAGEQKIQQDQRNEQGRIVLPANQTITFNGDVGNVTLVDQSGTRGDMGGPQSGQGSTDASQGASATQTPTAETEVSPDVDVSLPVK